MIRYALVCDRKHEFESWFHDSAAFDQQIEHALLACPVCGSTKVEKAIMAPRLARSRSRRATVVPAAAPGLAEGAFFDEIWVGWPWAAIA